MNLREVLRERVVCGDGAMGTELMAAGVPVDTCFEQVCLTEPDVVSGIHDAYVRAGAELIETNTFGANAARLRRYGLEDRVAEINARGVQLAQAAARPRGVLVAGSVGPLGIPLAEAGASALDAAAIFREQLTALLDAGVDALFFETFLDLAEMRIALQQLRKLDADVPAICSLVASEEGRLPSSLPLFQAFRELSRLGADVVGVNCVTGPHAMTRILQRIPGNFVVSAFPNAGYPLYRDGRFLYNAAPEYFGRAAKEFVENGARLVGGCCGVGPAHIRAMVEAVAGATPVRAKPVVVYPSGPEDVRARPQRPAETSILDLMRQGHRVVVTELDPPKTLDMERYYRGAQALVDAGSDVITLADNSLAILRVSNLAVAAVLKQRFNIMPLLHLSCRDRNLIGLQSELMGIAALGIRHVLPLTGDPAKFGDQPGASSVFDVNSVQLMGIINKLNEGFNFAGKNIKYPTDFVVGCTFNPNAKNLDAQLKRLERKLAAGASYVMTQPVFDRGLVRQMHECTKGFGVPILTGVWPLLNGRQAEFLHHEVPGVVVPDDVRDRMRGREGAEGRALGVEIAKEVVETALEHFPGLYLITPFLAYDTTAELAGFVRSLS